MYNGQGRIPGGATGAAAPPSGNLTPREVIKITYFHLKIRAVLCLVRSVLYQYLPFAIPVTTTVKFYYRPISQFLQNTNNSYHLLTYQKLAAAGSSVWIKICTVLWTCINSGIDIMVWISFYYFITVQLPYFIIKNMPFICIWTAWKLKTGLRWIKDGEAFKMVKLRTLKPSTKLVVFI